jgi:glyoxylase-like metal-dependent hydrolase (beta-lactamase superfamily II)
MSGNPFESMQCITRRDMLRRAGVISGATAAALIVPDWAWALQAQAAQGDQLAQMRAGMGATPITSTPLGERITMLGGPGGNVVVLRGPDGKVVVDTFVQPAWTNLKATLDKMGNERIATLIDTHWHFDHADNNGNFRKAGAAIVAHENTKKRLSESHELLGAKFPPAPPEALPTQTFANIHTIDANGEKITLGHIPPAHTDTDIYIKFQNANVLHLGDVFFNGSYPFIDASTGGSIGGMINGAEMAAKMADAKTRIVPGHGPVGDLIALNKYRDVLIAARDRVAKLKKSGQTVQQVIAAAPMKEFDATWGAGFMNPAQFLTIVYNTL